MQTPSQTLTWWASKGLTGANADEIERAKAAIGPLVPYDYLEFLQTYGFVEWDLDIPDSFEYRLLSYPHQVINKAASITHLWPARHIERMAADVRTAENDSLPLYYPNTHFPIGGTGGQAQIVLELEPAPGRIWFWPEREDERGSGDNTELGFVADNFTNFVEGLRLGDT